MPQALDGGFFNLAEPGAQLLILALADFGAHGALDSRLQRQAEILHIVDEEHLVAIEAELHPRFDDDSVVVGGGGVERQRHAKLRAQIDRAGAFVEQRLELALAAGGIERDKFDARRVRPFDDEFLDVPNHAAALQRAPEALIVVGHVGEIDAGLVEFPDRVNQQQRQHAQAEIQRDLHPISHGFPR